MRHRPMLLLAAALAAGAPLAVIHARADPSAATASEPIGELVHDLSDRAWPDRGAPVLAQRPTPPGQEHREHGAPATPSSDPQGGHKHGADHPHGTPSDWKFTLPKGDARKGRAVFVKFECYACHEVKGQKFAGAKAHGSIGPELSKMAGHHEAEFFAEAILNPNAVIDAAQYRAPDGTSRMPSYNDLMTVQELVDLVAFLKSLGPTDAADHKH
jgi:cytochrome c1